MLRSDAFGKKKMQSGQMAPEIDASGMTLCGSGQGNSKGSNVGIY